MEQEMLEYVRSQRVGVLSVELLDGSPHGATVHFAHTEDPLSFIFLTERAYKKCEAILEKGSVRASFVLGTDEGNMKTLQLDGDVKLINDKELEEIYFNKFPDKKEVYDGPDDIFLLFTPRWWRYTDWEKPEGKTILNSDGSIEVVG